MEFYYKIYYRPHIEGDYSTDFEDGLPVGWTTIDKDQMPVYPIALGSQTNIVSFPGSGTANNPTAIAPMVFNPFATTPAMMPADPAIAAPTGKKTVIPRVSNFKPQITTQNMNLPMLPTSQKEHRLLENE